MISFCERSLNMDDYLASVYYDPKRSGGFGGVDRLYKDVKKEGKFNISRTKIKEWLMKQDAYTLHKPIRRHFKRNRVIVGGIDQQWQMDLADMQSMQKFNNGYRYLLVCIDVFSKYAWVVPLKNKKGPSLVEAFKIILASGRKPEKIITDQGTEFFNKHFKALLKDEDIELYNTYNETKASVVEQLIRTLKTRMWRYFTAKKTMRYIDMLPETSLPITKSKFGTRCTMIATRWNTCNINSILGIKWESVKSNVRLKKDTCPTSQKRFLPWANKFPATRPCTNWKTTTAKNWKGRFTKKNCRKWSNPMTFTKWRRFWKNPAEAETYNIL